MRTRGQTKFHVLLQLGLVHLRLVLAEFEFMYKDGDMARGTLTPIYEHPVLVCSISHRYHPDSSLICLLT